MRHFKWGGPLLFLALFSSEAIGSTPRNGFQIGACGGIGGWCNQFGTQFAYNWKWIGLETSLNRHNRTTNNSFSISSVNTAWRLNLYNQNAMFRPFVSGGIALGDLENSIANGVLSLGAEGQIGAASPWLIQARTTVANSFGEADEEGPAFIPGASVAFVYNKRRADPNNHPASVDETPFKISRAGLCVGWDPTCVIASVRFEFVGRYLGIGFGGIGLSTGVWGKIYPSPLRQKGTLQWRPYAFVGATFAGRELWKDLGLISGGGIGADIHLGAQKRLILQPQLSGMESELGGPPMGGSLSLLWGF